MLPIIRLLFDDSRNMIELFIAVLFSILLLDEERRSIPPPSMFELTVLLAIILLDEDCKRMPAHLFKLAILFEILQWFALLRWIPTVQLLVAPVTVNPEIFALFSVTSTA